MANKFGGNTLIERVFFPSCVGIMIMVFIMVLTVMNVDNRWSKGESIFSWSLPIISMIALVYHFFNFKKEKNASFLDLVVLLWGLYYFFRVWIGAEYPCATQFLKEASIFLLYFALRGIFSYCKIPHIAIIITIIILGDYEAFLGLKQITIGDSRHYHYSLTGSFLNPGPYSAYILLTIIIGLVAKKDIFYYINRFQDKLKIFLCVLYFVALSLPAIVLPYTCSRAALISLVLICVWIYRKFYWKYKYLVWSGILVLFIGLYFIKQGSADGRILTWIASFTTWIHSPLTGVGVGGFRQALAEGISEMYIVNNNNSLFVSGNVSEYAFCDILKILVEQGIIGLTLCIIVIIAVLYNTYHFSIPLFYALLSLVIFSMFSYPFELYPYRVIFVLIATISLQRFKAVNLCRWKGMIIITTMYSIFILLSTFLVREIECRIKADCEARLFSGMKNTLYIKEYYKLLSFENDNAYYLFDFAKLLRKEGRYNDSNAMLRQGALVSNDPMFYVLQGNNYKDMGCCEHAEQAYQKAYSIMPNRIYPLYRLMVLYKDIDNKPKMKQIAQKILLSKPKVQSPATREMINKAKQCL